MPGRELTRPPRNTLKAEPRWDVPSPYGYAAAIDSMGSISAPLLAGFSFTLAVLVLSSGASPARWPNASIFLLIAGAFALISSVQFSFRARLYVVTPSEIEEWWPDPSETATRDHLRRVQRDHRRSFRRWSTPARYSYDLGLLCFLLGVTSLLAPRAGHVSDGRLAVVALALAAFVGELLWIALSNIPRKLSGLPEVGPEWKPKKR